MISNDDIHQIEERGVLTKENMKWVIVVILELYIIFAVNGIRKEICNLPGSYGNCTQIIVMWFHEILDHTCRELMYSGCGGNSNRFHTYQECYKTCIGTEEKGELTTESISTPNSNKNKFDLVSHVIIIPNYGGKNRNIKDLPQSRKSRDDIDSKNNNKSRNINRRDRPIKRKKSYKRPKSRIKHGQRPVNIIKKNARKIKTRANEENKVKRAKDKYRRKDLHFRMDENEYKVKNRKGEKENRDNCRQEHDRTNRSRGKNKRRKNCLCSPTRKNSVRKNSTTRKSKKRTGRRLKKKMTKKAND